MLYRLRYEAFLFEVFSSAGFCHSSHLTVALFCVIHNSIAFPDKGKEIENTKNPSKYVRCLRKGWRKPFRSKWVTCNYSRSFKIKSIILLHSEVINVYLLTAHKKKKELLDLASKDRGLRMAWSMSWGYLMQVQKKISFITDGARAVAGETNCSAGKREVWVRKVYLRHFFLMIFHFELYQPLDKLNFLCAVLK